MTISFGTSGSLVELIRAAETPVKKIEKFHKKWYELLDVKRIHSEAVENENSSLYTPFAPLDSLYLGALAEVSTINLIAKHGFHGIAFHNVQVNVDGRRTQIDHVIAGSGVWMIESKFRNDGVDEEFLKETQMQMDRAALILSEYLNVHVDKGMMIYTKVEGVGSLDPELTDLPSLLIGKVENIDRVHRLLRAVTVDMMPAPDAEGYCYASPWMLSD